MILVSWTPHSTTLPRGPIAVGVGGGLLHTGGNLFIYIYIAETDTHWVVSGGWSSGGPRDQKQHKMPRSPRQTIIKDWETKRVDYHLYQARSY